MKLLLHTCCGPCAIYPVRLLRESGWHVRGFFYRHNIHPYQECLRRQEALQKFATAVDLPVIYQQGYDIEGFLRSVAFREADRCRYCYHARLLAAAQTAKRGKFDAFSSTLLYSRHQNHERIRQIGEAIGASLKIHFEYQDFREGWQEGIDTSRRMGLYRQPYCGCIYSEKERYYRSGRPQAPGEDPSVKAV